MGIVEEFSKSPLFDEIGIITGSNSIVQFPNKPCLMVRFKTFTNNAGSFFIGSSSDTVSFELDAGEDTGWIATSNLNRYWYGKSSGTSDYLSYWLQR